MSAANSSEKHTNRLIHATSPYLLQHAHNPVDWYPWGDEAFARARAEDRPVFLSIGYAACHWCHVMERESFESESVAELLNRDFIAIKVDREERPDLDEVYMTATQLMTQSGGWPMSVFLTPDRKPFFAGTYFPPEDRWGRPGFSTLLRELHRAWTERRAQVEEQSERVTEAIARVVGGVEGQGGVHDALIQHSVEELARQYDPRYGGFGSAPKFPPSLRIELFLRRQGRAGDSQLGRMALDTLEQMARGGMYDQVGGGFHRYSVDERWLVPHFEKMLYDNALLARVYALAFEQTGSAFLGRVGREILDYVLREMTHPEGGFYSTTDADSEGEEGKFFVWTPDEVAQVLGPDDGAFFCTVYDIAPGGNFEGRSIPNLLFRNLAERAAESGTSEEVLDRRLAGLRQRLWEHREARVHPLLDDKILSGWNGLMIRAFAEGYRVYGDERYRQAAERAAEFVLGRMYAPGRLLRSWRNGEATLNGYQEDYASLSLALLDLHAVTEENRWRDSGLQLLDEMDRRFWDEGGGAYFFTSHDHEPLIARARSPQDGATPSGNSIAARALVRAAALTGDDARRRRATRLLMSHAPQMASMPAGFPNMLIAADEYLAQWPEGARIPGADAVQIEAFLSHTSVQPGDHFWIALRVAVSPGYHINSHRPHQPYLLPTELVVEPDGGFTVVAESYPDGEEYAAPFDADSLSVYAGAVLLGACVEAPRTVPPGRQTLQVIANLQACDDQQCYPPMEARIRIHVAISTSPGEEQHPEIFDPIRARPTGAAG